MKNLFFISAVFTVLLFSSCSETQDYSEQSKDELIFNMATPSQARALGNAEQGVSIKSAGPCDLATRTVIYHTGAFRFKRPKFDCNQGFWFCTTAGEWYVDCYRYDTLLYSGPISELTNRPKSASSSGAGVNLPVEIVYSANSTVFMKFPLEYFDSSTYTTEDLNFLSVDDQLDMPNGSTLKLGQYPTFELDGFLIAEVDIN